MTNQTHIPDHSPAAILEAYDAALIRAAFAKMEAKEMKQYREEIKSTAVPRPKRSDTIRSLRRRVRARKAHELLTHHLPRAAQLAACLIGILAIGTGVAFAASSAARQWAAGVLVGSEPVIDETDGFWGWETYYDGFVDGVSVGDAVYLLDQNNQTIRRLESTDAEPQLYQPETPYDLRAMALVESGGEVYMLCEDEEDYDRDTMQLRSGQKVHLYRLRFGDDARYGMEQVFEADTEALLGFEGNHTARFDSEAASAGGRLYFLASAQVDDPIENAFGDEIYQSFAIVCDPESGEPRVLPLPDGVSDTFFSRLYLYSGPENRLYVAHEIGVDDINVLSIYRLEDGEVFVKTGEYPGMFGAFGFVYRFDNDSVYYTMNGSIYAAPGGDFANAQRVGITPEENGRGLIVGENGYMLVNEDHAKVFDLSADLSGTVELVINGNGGYSPSIGEALNAENPNVTVRMDERRDYNADYSSILDDVPDGVDIWTLDSVSLPYFRDAGYCAPLESEILSEIVDKLWPGSENIFRNADGELIAIPSFYCVYPDYEFNIELLAELGIPREELPDTWPEFLKLLARLSRDPNAQKYYTFMDSPIGDGNPAVYFARRLYIHMLDSYGRICTAQNQPIDYSDARFQELMELFQQIDFSGLDYRDAHAGGSSEDSLILDTPVYDTAFIGADSPILPVTLKLTEDGPTVSRISGDFVLIDPNSAHKAEALRYLEVIVEEYSEGLREYLFNEGESASPEENYQHMLDALGMVGEYTLYYHYDPDGENLVDAMADAGQAYFSGEIDYAAYAQRMNALISQ